MRLLDPRVLEKHLRRFFGISVAKGRYDPLAVPEIADQMKELGRSIPTYRMPAPARLDQWKRKALDLSQADRHAGEATIGALLDIASTLDAANGKHD